MLDPRQGSRNARARVGLLHTHYKLTILTGLKSEVLLSVSDRQSTVALLVYHASCKKVTFQLIEWIPKYYSFLQLKVQNCSFLIRNSAITLCQIIIQTKFRRQLATLSFAALASTTETVHARNVAKEINSYYFIRRVCNFYERHFILNYGPSYEFVKNQKYKYVRMVVQWYSNRPRLEKLITK